MIVDNEEFNSRIVVYALIFLVLGGLLVWSIIPQKKIVNESESVNITPNVSVITIYQIVTVTPTPDGINYFSSEYQNGSRLINHPFTFNRFFQNVTNISYSITSKVWEYKRFDVLHYFDENDYNIYPAYPSPGNDFLFVMFDMRMNDFAHSNGAYYIDYTNMFGMGYKGQLILPDTTSLNPSWRLLELNNTYNYDNTNYITPFAQMKVYEPSYKSAETITGNDNISYTTSNIVYTNGGYVEIADNFLHPGQTNDKSGWILFQIPKDADIKDLEFYASFASLGHSSWKLYNQPGNEVIV